MSKKKLLEYVVDLNRKIGEGTFGEVFVGYSSEKKIEVAVKQLNKLRIDRDQFTRAAIFSQIQNLKTLRSNNIVTFYDFLISQHHYYIVQQLCDRDLREYLEQKVTLNQAEAIDILTQICNGFADMIQQGIIHRDLKPENILIKKKNIKIADFGLSKKIYNLRSKTTGSVGTPTYMSLQLLTDQPYSSKCDIWAIGCIFYQMLHGVTSWTGYSQCQLVENIKSQTLLLNRLLSKNTRDFLIRCLSLSQYDRISWDQVLRHPIFGNRFQNYIKKQQQLEDKLKFLMNQLRYLIKAQNIDLFELFQQKGYNHKTELNFQHFQTFLLTVDSTFTKQEEIFIFKTLDTDDSNTICFQQLEQSFKKYNIPMRSFNSLSYANIQPTSNVKMFQEVYNKFYDILCKINRKIAKHNLKLRKVFDSYNLSKSGTLNRSELHNMLTKLDVKIQPKECEIIFDLLDDKNEEKIDFLNFQTFFYKTIGKPYRDFMTIRQ